MAKKPEDCQTMIDVREGVDAIDRELVQLLVTRQAYMHAAARIKPNRESDYYLTHKRSASFVSFQFRPLSPKSQFQSQRYRAY